MTVKLLYTKEKNKKSILSFFAWLEDKYLTKECSSGNRRKDAASFDRLLQCATSFIRAPCWMENVCSPCCVQRALLCRDFGARFFFVYCDTLGTTSYFLTGYKLKPPNSAGKEWIHCSENAPNAELAPELYIVVTHSQESSNEI